MKKSLTVLAVALFGLTSAEAQQQNADKFSQQYNFLDRVHTWSCIGWAQSANVETTPALIQIQKKPDFKATLLEETTFYHGGKEFKAIIEYQGQFYQNDAGNLWIDTLTNRRLRADPLPHPYFWAKPGTAKMMLEASPARTGKSGHYDLKGWSRDSNGSLNVECTPNGGLSLSPND